MNEIPCTKCTAKCCKNYDVFIDHQDIKNFFYIKDDFSFCKKIEYSKDFGYVPKFKLWVNGVKKSWIVCLNNPNRVCHFLKNDICTVYDKRPQICRSYPFYYDKNKVKEMQNICPVKWVLDLKKKETVKKDYDQLLLNFLTFETICDNWNKIVKKENTFENFLTFVKGYEN